MPAPERLPLALYVHLPWCVRKCPYCDFNSYTQDGAIPEEAYVDALLADLDADHTEALDRLLKLKGQIAKEDWPGQAKKLADATAA